MFLLSLIDLMIDILIIRLTIGIYEDVTAWNHPVIPV